MALDPTALVTLEELKSYMGGVTGGNRDSAYEHVINIASRAVQEFLGRKLCDASLTTPWTRTEYHTPDGSHILRLLDRPIVSITSVHEDATRAYGASALLVENTDFVVDKPLGRLYRVQSGGGAMAWECGFESVKVVAVLGYRDHKGLPQAATDVPADVKDVTLWAAARMYKEMDKRSWDVSTQTDPTGTVTHFSASRLPPMQQERLMAHAAWSSTGRRAA